MSLTDEERRELEELLPAVVVITQNIDGLHQRAGSTLIGWSPGV